MITVYSAIVKTYFSYFHVANRCESDSFMDEYLKLQLKEQNKLKVRIRNKPECFFECLC